MRSTHKQKQKWDRKEYYNNRDQSIDDGLAAYIALVRVVFLES